MSSRLHFGTPRPTEAPAAADDLRRTLLSPRSSRRDVLAAIERVPGFAERLRGLSLPVRRDQGGRRSLEALVALLGFDRLRAVLEAFLDEQERDVA